MINNYRIAESKVKFEKILPILIDARGDAKKMRFMAKDFDFSGATCSSLVQCGIIRIVDKEECWFKINADTMKKGYVNVYEFDVDIHEIREMYVKQREIKLNKLEERIERLKTQLAKAYEDLDNL